MGGVALPVFVMELRPILSKRGLMQNPSLTLKIEMFGNLVDELEYWNKCCANEADSDIQMEYCENKFKDVLDACREVRDILMVELNEYVDNCKSNQIPISLDYWRIRKQLQEVSFDYFEP